MIIDNGLLFWATLNINVCALYKYNNYTILLPVDNFIEPNEQFI